MNILYCGDRGIARGTLVSILSILKYNPQVLHFYILTINYKDTKAFTEKSAKFLDELVKKMNKKSFVKLIDATDVFVKNLPKKNMGSYFTPCSMLRLYIDKVPEINQLDRVLYLDYDVVCRGDLSEFYDMDLANIEAAGVLDIYGRRWYHYHGLFKQDYMNSVKTGKLLYFDAVHESIDVNIAVNKATVVGKTKVLASPFGATKSWWRLRQDLIAEKIAGEWKIIYSKASTY